MEKLKKIKRIPAVLTSALLIVVAVIVLTQMNQTRQENPNLILSTKQHSLSQNGVIASSSGTIVGYTVLEMMERSTLMVYGTLTEISEAFMVEGVSGGYQIFTDMTVVPDKTLRGEEKKEIVVRIEGGQIGDYFAEYEEVPEFKLGEEWLLFLSDPGCGGGVNTKGDYYYLTGYYQAAFKRVDGTENLKEAANNEKYSDTVFVNSLAIKNDIEDADVKQFNVNEKSVRNIESLMLMDIEPSRTSFSLSQLQSYTKVFNEEAPIDYDRTRRETLEACESNLKLGMITQEEYDSFTKGIDMYARILTDEEVEKMNQGPLRKKAKSS